MPFFLSCGPCATKKKKKQRLPPPKENTPEIYRSVTTDYRQYLSSTVFGRSSKSAPRGRHVHPGDAFSSPPNRRFSCAVIGSKLLSFYVPKLSRDGHNPLPISYVLPDVYTSKKLKKNPSINGPTTIGNI